VQHSILTHAEQLDVQISAAMFAQLASKADNAVARLVSDVIYIDTRASAYGWFRACAREEFDGPKYIYGSDGSVLDIQAPTGCLS